jgi:Glycine zipper 2TM domain
MEINQPSRYRIHPLMAGAAVSVMLVSLIGVAAMTGVLPNSHASAAETARLTAQAAALTPAPAPAQPLAATNASPDYKLPYAGPVSAQHAAMAPAVRDEAPVHKHAVQHRRHPVQHAQAPSGQQYSQQPAYQQPAPAPAAPVARYSPIGIGVGAVVGGLLGNQVGGGTGKTLATVAGAVGGGYVGNEIAKRNP